MRWHVALAALGLICELIDRLHGHVAVAVDKLLHGTAWRAMRLDQMPDELETRAELGMQRARVVANNAQAAASGRSLRTKCRDNDMATGPYCPRDLAHVGRALLRRRQKMKHGAIVPDVVLRARKIKRACVPAVLSHGLCKRSEPLPCDIQSRRGQIEHFHVAVTACQEIVN